MDGKRTITCGDTFILQHQHCPGSHQDTLLDKIVVVRGRILADKAGIHVI